MNWDCTESDKRLSDYLEGLTSAEETAVFKAHIEGCADCAALVARVGGTVRMLRATPAVDVPQQLFRNIIAATSGAPARGWRRWIQPARIAWQPQFAMGAITIAASFLIIFHAANSSRTQGFAALNPMNLFRAADRTAHLTYAHTAKFVNDMRLVYEIESRLDMDQSQDSQPATQPPAPQQNHDSQPDSQPKSQAAPPRTSRFFRGRSFYASETHRNFYVTVTRSRS
ncbi:MAG TPA: zf-HC2 domain-containing protein [Candidatus Acidoferrales bacterium]|nr:zf-HC2 domain-containing protein [Candidatus Acidoferrales bacterium]